MSVNRREDILARLQEIVNDTVLLPGYTTRLRNRGNLTNEKLPAIALLDGDETVVSNPRAPRGRNGVTAALTRMTPQIFILLRTKQPTGVEDNVNVGTTLNELRGVILRVIAADAQLKALVGPNGGIEYEGAETDLKTGMDMAGQMQLNYAITYVTNPNA